MKKSTIYVKEEMYPPPVLKIALSISTTKKEIDFRVFLNEFKKYLGWSLKSHASYTLFFLCGSDAMVFG